jgi:tetratricopeptide (TPR) repeat protein
MAGGEGFWDSFGVLMSSRLLRWLLCALAAAVITVPYFFCRSPKSELAVETAHSDWLNVYDTAAHYVGMGTCRNCHASVYESFMQTGMGQSFAPASRQKSAGDFVPAHALVYDKENDFYYKPYFLGDSLYIKEYRLEGTDTIHKRIERVDYIIGSGQHTNSHIYNINGYLYQAPITFYTQRGKWDLAPGFEKGSSLRFSRLIQLECMSCHNGYPEFVANSENKYVNLKHGIDCERCHGPGSLHVADKSAGRIVDTSLGPDYTIVNPRRLSTELQNNVCQRCHLQGIAVLNEGKGFYDFRPGMQLSEVMNVFMPQYEGAQDKMIMASHVERMKKSPCYVQSNRMSCITCHNPHLSVKVTPRTQFLNACYSCHNSAKGQDLAAHGCTEEPTVRAAKGNDCISCHMPHNGSIDIPHVAVTDHFIRKRPLADAEKSKITAFLGLKCYNNDAVDAVTTARAFLEFYERYQPSPPLLDSALQYLSRQTKASRLQTEVYIRTYFLKGDYAQVQQYAGSLKQEEVTDPWTCYRIGEAYKQEQDAAKALPWYARAVEIWPYALDFQNKYGACQLALNDLPAAEKTFKFILSENPKHSAAAGNLGYLYLQQAQPSLAYEYLMRSVAADPDATQVLINLAVYYHNANDPARCRLVLTRLLRRHPEHEQARAMLEDLSGSQAAP